jgi:dTDP-4-amino-4,6-dideoxygalactose transaminase
MKTYFEKIEIKDQLPCKSTESALIEAAHLMPISLGSRKNRDQAISYLQENGVYAVSHYQPLGTSAAAQTLKLKKSVQANSQIFSDQICRLPLYYGMTEQDQGRVLDIVNSEFMRKLC